MDDLLAEFIAETRETLDALSGELIAWEADPSDRAKLDSIFRFIHTVKGSCGFLDLPRFERLSHAAEDVLAELRGGTRRPDAATVNAVLAIVDRIGELTEALEGGEEPSADDGHLIAALTAEAAAPAATAAAATVTQVARHAPTRSIRVPLDLLDRMMGGVSDMVLARNELARRLRDVDAPMMEGAFERLSACVAEMRDAITRTRMQRIDKLFSALPRIVRDLSNDLGKQVDLVVEGSDVELDREMIELIRDPLTHIVRNSVDHGIEAPEARLRAGKPAMGRLRIAARQSGNQIELVVTDDGAGIDADRVLAKAVAAGLVEADAGARMDAGARADLVFLPGLSTATSVTAISGRGVGMDVVRANIERIGGVIDLANRPGRGLRIVIRVPLTLTIIAALTVRAGGQGFAIPRSAIEEIVRDTGDAIRVDALAGGSVATIRGRTLPLVQLETVMGIETPLAERGRTLIVVRVGAGGAYVLGVETVHDHEELVIKPASPPVMGVGLYAGMTLPDNGVPMLLLDVVGIAAAAGVSGEAGEAAPAPVDAAAPAAAGVSTLLFRDLDGRVRGLRLSVIERIEDVEPAQASMAGGRMRVAVDGRLLPLIGADAGVDADRLLKIVRMTDGHVELAHAIDDVIDIVSLPEAPDAAMPPGPIAGIALVGDAHVELLDPFHLFAVAKDAVVASGRAAVRIVAGDDPWMREILAPLVRAAGYAIVTDADAAADLVLVGDAGAVAAAGAAPVLRLLADRPLRAGEGVYRYDRLAVLDAVEAMTRKAG